MSAILGWLSSGFSWLGNFLGGLLGAGWGMVQGLLDVVGATVVTIIGTALSMVSAAVFAVLGTFTGLMPVVSRPGDTAVSAAVAALDQANRYIPVGEILLLLPVWAAVYVGVVLYKAWKAVPFV